jgi:hypothetical protein
MRDAMIPLAQLLDRQGRTDEAVQWLGTTLHDDAAANQWIIPELARLYVHDGHQAEAERWLQFASDKGSVDAMIPLAQLLQNQGRLEEAEEWLLVASYEGSVDAMIPLAQLLDRQGRSDKAGQWHQRAEPIPIPDLSAIPQYSHDWAPIVTTAIITTAVVPFVQTIVTKAAEDSYAAAKALLRRLLRQQAGSTQQSQGTRGGPHVVVMVKDPHLDITVELQPTLSDEALRALARLDIEQLASRAKRGPIRVSFDPATGAWEVEPSLVRRSRRGRAAQRRRP